MKNLNLFFELIIYYLILGTTNLQENSFRVQETISTQQDPQLKNLLQDPNIQKVLLKQLSQKETFSELFESSIQKDNNREPGVQKPNPKTQSLTQNRQIFSNAVADSILDPMNILLQNIRYYAGLQNLDSDLRIIYYKEVLPEQEVENQLPKKYIICFYMKIEGLIKYLGIEFSVLKDKVNPIFIEQSLLMTNLDKLKYILGIKEIDFKFFAFYENLFLRLLNNANFNNFQRSFDEQKLSEDDIQDITFVKLQDPNFLIQKVQQYLNENFQEGATLVSYWQKEKSLLFKFSDDFEKMGYLCVKLLPSLTNTNIFLIQEIYFSKNQKNAAGICQIYIDIETSISKDNQIVLQRLDISTNEDISPFITLKKNEYQNTLTNFPEIQTLQNKTSFESYNTEKKDPFDITNTISLTSNNQENIQGISFTQNLQQRQLNLIILLDKINMFEQQNIVDTNNEIVQDMDLITAKINQCLLDTKHIVQNELKTKENKTLIDESQINLDSEDECLSILQRDSISFCKEQAEIKTLDKSKLFDDTRAEENTQTTCSCTKSNCMRLNCSCFKLQGFCSPECKCQNCLNQLAYSDIRSFVLEKTKFINRAAFTENLYFYNDIVIGKKGCKCVKGCQKSYCSCFKNKAQCSSICKCVCCNNSKVDLDKKEVQKIYQYLPRKKYKISIDFTQQQQTSQNKHFCKVSFDNYQNKQQIEFFTCQSMLPFFYVKINKL